MAGTSLITANIRKQERKGIIFILFCLEPFMKTQLRNQHYETLPTLKKLQTGEHSEDGNEK